MKSTPPAAATGTLPVAPSQDVAWESAFEALPEAALVLDGEGRLRYRGAPDLDYQDDGKNAEWLRGALDALLDGRDPDPAETEPVGCSVKWR